MQYTIFTLNESSLFDWVFHSVKNYSGTKTLKNRNAKGHKVQIAQHNRKQNANKQSTS